MLTDQEIQCLIEFPKMIFVKTPAAGYKQENGHKRCDLRKSRTDTSLTNRLFGSF